MNITDLIVELLEQGQRVALPGIGTLESVMQSAHHDPDTRTYYPASRTVGFNKEANVDNSIVQTIASRECVSEEVARQMWLNYIDALSDKVRRSGSHTFGRLGQLVCSERGEFDFHVAEGLALSADNPDEVPIEEVKIYNHDNDEDPFAKFDEESLDIREVKPEAQQPAAEEIPSAPETPSSPPTEPQTAAPAIPTKKEDEPAATAEPSAEQEPAEEAWNESLQQLDSLQKPEPTAEELALAEEERKRAEKKAEAERIRLERKAEEERKLEEEMMEKKRRAEEEKEIKERRKAEEELRKAEKKAEEESKKAAKKAEESRIKAEKKAAALAAITARETAKAEENARKEAEKAAEKERRKVEKETAKAAEKAEKERRKAEKKAAKNSNTESTTANELLNPTPASTYSTDDDGKKKRRLLPIAAIILGVLLIGGGAYYWLTNRGQKPAITESASVRGGHLDVPNTNAFTYNTDLITFSQREVAVQSNMVCRLMTEYVDQFLSERNYASARVPMMDRIRQYSEQRLGEMLGERFAVQRLVPYNDYIYESCKGTLKEVCGRKARVDVQKELMNYRALDDILYNLVDELGLQPGNGQQRTAAEVKQVKDNEKKAAEKKKGKNGESPAFVYVEKGSKQGFDIIAGFYLNKNTAAKMTARLHEQGCDAYIIEFNDLYYVSMGSASSQTSADALYKHIKSWYDGDVVIKKW